MLNKKKILITGANGFIGLNVVKIFSVDSRFIIYALVHNNCSSELLSIPDLRVIRADVSNKNIVNILSSISDFDYVVHIAGLAKDIGCDDKFKKINFNSVKYLSKISKEKFVYVSSTDVYGIKDFVCANEDTKFLNFPCNPYPKYKILSEKWIFKNCKKFVIIRPAAVWGMNDKTLENRVKQFLKISPFFVYFGKWKGKNRWPLASVDNVAKTIYSLVLHDNFDNKAINIIDSKFTSIDLYYKNIARKYFPNKKFYTLYLPMWFGKIIGFISTFVSNLLNLNEPIFEPTYYGLHHISSNLDFSNDRMLKALALLEQANNYPLLTTVDRGSP